MDHLQRFDELYGGRLKSRCSNVANLEECPLEADPAIGAIYLHGRRTLKPNSRDLPGRMQAGAALVEVSVDQDGIAETLRPTTHSAPFYLEEGVVHYCVGNMPGAVARTSTRAEATLPYPLPWRRLGRYRPSRPTRVSPPGSTWRGGR